MNRVLRAIVIGLLLATCASAQTRAEQSAERVVRLGYVGIATESTPIRGFAGLWKRLAELGWVEGRNLVVLRRWAEGRPDRLPALMGEMVAQKVDVIITAGTPAAIAAKKATNTIPIVVIAMGDAVGTGLAASLARPGGNLTGFSHGWVEGFSGKWLELLQEALPRLDAVAVIFNPGNPLCVRLAEELRANAPQRKLKLQRIEVRTRQSIDRAFEQAQRQAQAVIVLTDPLTYQYQGEIALLALKHGLPSIYTNLEFVDAGGLMAYGVDIAPLATRTAEYVDKILRGTKPGDLPIEQPTHVAVVVNLQTARALGVTIPESILLRADEVIR